MCLLVISVFAFCLCWWIIYIASCMSLFVCIYVCYWLLRLVVICLFVIGFMFVVLIDAVTLNLVVIVCGLYIIYVCVTVRCRLVV